MTETPADPPRPLVAVQPGPDLVREATSLRREDLNPAMAEDRARLIAMPIVRFEIAELAGELEQEYQRRFATVYEEPASADQEWANQMSHFYMEGVKWAFDHLLRRYEALGSIEEGS